MMKFLIVVIVSILVLFVFAFSLFLNYFFIMRRKANGGLCDEEIFELHEYKYLSFDSSTNQVMSSGFVTRYDNLEEEEEIGFVSKMYDDHNHILISNFGEREFVCGGSCFCFDESKRRRTVRSSSKFVYLVSALSSTIALSIAKTHFTEEVCKTSHFSTTCSSFIRSEVDSCDDLFPPREIDFNPTKEDEDADDVINEDLLDDWEGIYYDEEKGEYLEKVAKFKGYGDNHEYLYKKKIQRFQRFLCTGKCIRNRQLRKPEYVEQSKKFDCSRLEFTHSVRIRYDFEKGYPNEFGYIEEVDGPSEDEMIEQAKQLFMSGSSSIQTLNEFCEHHSSSSPSLVSEKLCKGKKSGEKVPDVKCIKIEADHKLEREDSLSDENKPIKEFGYESDVL